MSDRAAAFFLSVGAGGAWNLVNLWCLRCALNAWLCERPSYRRSLGWFVVKFPVWYAVAVGLLLVPGISVVGFGLGFIVVLTSALLFGVITSQRALPAPLSHGR